MVFNFVFWLFFFFKRQPPEVLYQKKFPKKFQKIHRSTPLLEYLFNKVVDLRPEALLKKKPRNRCFPKNRCFPEHRQWLLLFCASILLISLFFSCNLFFVSFFSDLSSCAFFLLRHYFNSAFSQFKKKLSLFQHSITYIFFQIYTSSQ